MSGRPPGIVLLVGIARLTQGQPPSPPSLRKTETGQELLAVGYTMRGSGYCYDAWVLDVITLLQPLQHMLNMKVVCQSICNYVL